MSEGVAPTDVLPHRPPFLYLDEVVSSDELNVHARVTFPADAEFFKGHFPGRPIVPGVLLIEAMAQALAYLALYDPTVKGVYLTGIDRARFRKPVLPDQLVDMKVTIEHERLAVVRAKAEAFVDGERVCDAKLSGLKDRKDR